MFKIGAFVHTKGGQHLYTPFNSMKTSFVYLGRMVLRKITAPVDSVPKRQERVGGDDTL